MTRPQIELLKLVIWKTRTMSRLDGMNPGFIEIRGKGMSKTAGALMQAGLLVRESEGNGSTGFLVRLPLAEELNEWAYHADFSEKNFTKPENWTK